MIALATLGPAEATRTLAAYRTPHVIDPEYSAQSRERNWCRTCGVTVYPVARGRLWRHDMSEVCVLEAVAEAGWPR